jgi:hypothetical protein
MDRTPQPRTTRRVSKRARWAAALVVGALAPCAAERVAHAQACCVGSSGLTPGWLGNHENALIGAQLRLSHTLGTYPASGQFYVPTPGRDGKMETSLFATVRFLRRAQVSTIVPLVVTRRRAGGVTETRASFGDVAVSGRYDFLRAGESRIPGIAGLLGFSVPTGTPSDRGSGLLSADVTGTGAWEVTFGGSVEQTFGRVVLHATALAGIRTSREVLGLPQHVGPRGLFVAAAGYVWDGEVTTLSSLAHQSEGDATVGGQDAPGTGSRTTQAAFLVVVPIDDTLRLRTTLFTDVPPLGENRPVMAGSTLSLVRSWL